MDVREAVRLAKAHIADLFADEEIEDIGLEEAVLGSYEPTGVSAWRITIGFTRPWNRKLDTATMMRWQHRARAYKTVEIDVVNGAILGVTDRVLAERA